MLSTRTLNNLIKLGGQRKTSKNSDRICFGIEILGTDGLNFIDAKTGRICSSIDNEEQRQQILAKMAELLELAQADADEQKFPLVPVNKSDSEMAFEGIARICRIWANARLAQTTADAPATNFDTMSDAELPESHWLETSHQLTIDNPMDNQKLENWKNMVTRYAGLLRNSTGFERLEITTFRLFFHGMDAQNEAHRMLVDYMRNFAEAEGRKIRAQEELHSDNERFAFRTWLIRLGWKGRETTKLRTSLYKGLTGNSAFCSEASKMRWKDKWAIKKDGEED